MLEIVVCTVYPFLQYMVGFPNVRCSFCFVTGGQRFLAHPAGRNDYAGAGRGFAKDGGISNEGPLNRNGKGLEISMSLYMYLSPSLFLSSIWNIWRLSQHVYLFCKFSDLEPQVPT